MAEHRLSLAVNGEENLLHQRLITYRAEDHAGAGQENGRQVTAGSVAIVGLGYVGLPTAVALHGAARRIIGVDRDEQRLRDILAQDADLAHTLHPRTDYSWAYSCPQVLDGTYQFFGAAHRAVV